MSIVNLARFQFAMTTVFHFFFVPLSVGMVFMVFLMEAIYVKTGDEKWKTRTKFFGSIMLLSFAVGVVTGIIQEFQFGMNWSDYSRFVGDIFGAPLAVEALLAFFMESTFLGIWLFGWDRLGKKTHLLIIFLTWLGSTLSALWILAANSFMQNPVGYKLTGGRATLTNFFALLSNPQTMLSFSHVVTGFFIAGGFVVAGISAFQLIKKRDVEIFRPVLRLGLLIALLGALGNFVAGDQSMLEVKNSQPMKFAAAEGITDTHNMGQGESAPWGLIGFFNESTHQKVFGIQVPMMLSILTYHQTTNRAPIQDIDQLNNYYKNHFTEAFPEANPNAVNQISSFVPPMNALFWSFRIMAGLSMLMILTSALGLFWTRKKKAWLFEHTGWLHYFGWVLFAPFLAITSGWLITELGRWPWTVYGLFTIPDSVSQNVSVGSLLFSNIVYFVLFCGLGAVMVVYSVHVMRQPAEQAETSYASIDPFSKEAFDAHFPKDDKFSIESEGK